MTVLIIASFPSELEKIPEFRNSEILFDEKPYRLSRAAFGKAELRFGITGQGRSRVLDFFKRYFAKAGSHDLPDLLVSTGYAGALAHFLQAGDVAAAREVFDYKSGKRYLCDVPSFVADRYPLLTCLSVDRFYASEAKAMLSRELPQADFVDMESGAAAETCTARKIPFLVLRAVSDPAGFRLPSAKFVQDSWKRVPLKERLAALFLNPPDFFSALAFQRNLSKAKTGIAEAFRSLLEGLAGPA